MSKVNPVNGMILVEPLDKLKKKAGENPFANIVASNNLGTVKHSSTPDYSVGLQIYFGSQYEKIIVDGAEVLAMKVENVIATVTD